MKSILKQNSLSNLELDLLVKLYQMYYLKARKENYNFSRDELKQYEMQVDPFFKIFQKS